MSLAYNLPPGLSSADPYFYDSYDERNPDAELCSVCGKSIGDFEYEDEPICEGCDELNMEAA